MGLASNAALIWPWAGPRPANGIARSQRLKRARLKAMSTGFRRMKALFTLVFAVIFAAWVSAIAILAVQNFTPVAFKFLTFQSIELPLGVVLGFGVGLGAILGAIAPLLLIPNFDRED